MLPGDAPGRTTRTGVCSSEIVSNAFVRMQSNVEIHVLIGYCEVQMHKLGFLELHNEHASSHDDQQEVGGASHSKGGPVVALFEG